MSFYQRGKSIESSSNNYKKYLFCFKNCSDLVLLEYIVLVISKKYLLVDQNFFRKKNDKVFSKTVICTLMSPNFESRRLGAMRTLCHVQFWNCRIHRAFRQIYPCLIVPLFIQIIPLGHHFTYFQEQRSEFLSKFAVHGSSTSWMLCLRH